MLPLKKLFYVCVAFSMLLGGSAAAQDFRLTPEGYFRNGGVDVMAFYDFYPEGHQSGVSILMNGQR
ncbi:MAG: hypothetical protein IJ202_14920, partial [Bacteroidales bacterium]|nr:hypothetical protein [Bacteroidales bacterium]